MENHRTAKLIINSVFLVGGLLMFTTFFVVPSSSSVLGLAETMWRESSYTGLGASMLMFILGVALFACYLGIRRLLNTPESPLLYFVHMGAMLALSLLAQLAFLWLYREIQDKALSVSWSGFVIGLVTNLVILLVACLDLYLVVDARNREAAYVNEDERVEPEPAESRERAPSAIEVQIYQNYLAQDSRAWAFGEAPVEAIDTFHPVPYRPEKDDWLILRRPWRLVLEMRRSGYPGVLTAGVDLYGDIVLGRSRNKKVGRITYDLSDYDARRLGVSRHHLLLRATGDALYVIDLGSSHGTKVDQELIDPFTAFKIHDGCEISLGNRFILRFFIIKSPQGHAVEAVG